MCKCGKLFSNGEVNKAFTFLCFPFLAAVRTTTWNSIRGENLFSGFFLRIFFFSPPRPGHHNPAKSPIIHTTINASLWACYCVGRSSWPRRRLDSPTTKRLEPVQKNGGKFVAREKKKKHFAFMPWEVYIFKYIYNHSCSEPRLVITLWSSLNIAISISGGERRRVCNRQLSHDSHVLKLESSEKSTRERSNLVLCPATTLEHDYSSCFGTILQLFIYIYSKFFFSHLNT